METKAKNVYIYTDEDAVNSINSDFFDNYLEENFGDYTFIVCEDGKTFISDEEESTIFIQEYFE